MFLGESKSTLFDLQKVDAFRNHWLRFVYNTAAQPKCSNLCYAFYGWPFRESSRLQGWLYEGYLKKKRVNSDFAMTICRFWISDHKYVLLLVQVFAIDFKCGVLCVTRRACVCVCVRVCVCVCVCEGNRVTSQRRVQPVRNHLNRSLCANTYEHHHYVCHATLFPFWAWTDKTKLKAEARDYGKGRYISDTCLWCSANHNVLCQLANQSRLCLSEGGACVENEAFERGGE